MFNLKEDNKLFFSNNFTNIFAITIVIKSNKTFKLKRSNNYHHSDFELEQLNDNTTSDDEESEYLNVIKDEVEVEFLRTPHFLRFTLPETYYADVYAVIRNIWKGKLRYNKLKSKTSPFQITMAKLEDDTGISETGLRKIIDVLVERGYISIHNEPNKRFYIINDDLYLRMASIWQNEAKLKKIRGENLREKLQNKVKSVPVKKKEDCFKNVEKPVSIPAVLIKKNNPVNGVQPFFQNSSDEPLGTTPLFVTANNNKRSAKLKSDDISTDNSLHPVKDLYQSKYLIQNCEKEECETEECETEELDDRDLDLWLEINKIDNSELRDIIQREGDENSKINKQQSNDYLRQKVFLIIKQQQHDDLHVADALTRRKAVLFKSIFY